MRDQDELLAARLQWETEGEVEYIQRDSWKCKVTGAD